MAKYKILTLTLLVVTSAFGAFGDVISSFPLAPQLLASHGLTWDGAYLWSCDNLRVFRLTTTGSIISSFKIAEGPQYLNLWGAAYDGSYLWISEVTNLDDPVSVFRFTTSGSLVAYFAIYNFSDGGLTWNNGYVWVDGRKYTTNGSLVSSFSIGGPRFRDSAFVGHYIWASGSDLTYVYEWTTTGSCVASFPSPDGGQPTGKTFDGQYLWVVSSYAKAADPYYAYQIDIGVVGMDPASFGEIKALYR